MDNLNINESKKSFSEYTKKGGPGRPIGSGNRLYALKQQFAKPEYQDKILAIFEEMLHGSKSDRREALKVAMTLLPREDKITQEIAQLVINKRVIENSEPKIIKVNCPKCNEYIELEI